MTITKTLNGNEAVLSVEGWLDTGGMGIMLARNNSKEMIYSRVGGRNMLTLMFEITG